VVDAEAPLTMPGLPSLQDSLDAAASRPIAVVSPEEKLKMERALRLSPVPLRYEADVQAPVVLSSYDDFVQQFGPVAYNIEGRTWEADLRPLWRRALAFLDRLLFHR